MIGDTSMREKILKFIINYISAHGYAPTMREIGTGVGLASVNTVHSHIARMLHDGILETDAGFGACRAIRVPGYKFVKEN